MSRPASADRTIQIGSNAPLAWRMRGGTVAAPTDLDLTGTAFRFTVYYRGAEILEKSTDESDSGLELVSYIEVDPDSGADPSKLDTVIWTPSLEESRSIPLGRLSKYELEHRFDSTQEPVVVGYLIGEGGLNDDNGT